MAAPTIPLIQLHPLCSDQSLSFFYNPPASEGDSALASMTFESISPAVLCNVSYQGSPYTITGLTNQTDYTFTMTVTNTNNNTSPAATFRTVQPGNVPPPPGFQCMTFTSTTTGIVYLSTMTEANAGLNRGYVIYVADPTTNQVIQRVTTAPYNTSKYLTGLPTNSWFKFFVRQVNDSGQSGQSPDPNTWQYFNYPAQFGTSSNALKIWVDGAQMAPSVYGANVVASPNFAIQSPYFWTGGGLMNLTTALNLNNHPVFNIDNNNGNAISSNFVESPSISYFFVGAQVSGVYAFMNPVQNRTYSNVFLGYENGIKRIFNLDGGTTYDSEQLSPDGAIDIISITRDGNTTEAIFRYNGSTIYTAPTTTSSITDITFGLGYWSPPPGIYLGEMCYYTTNLNTSEVEQMEGYLAWKWSLTANLPPTHPYKNTAP